MHLPAALEQWAAEHNEQLSQDTLDEVHSIANTIASSPAGSRLTSDPVELLTSDLDGLFTGARAERAMTLIKVVSGWAASQPAPEPPAPEPVSEDEPPTELTPHESPEAPVAAHAIEGAEAAETSDTAETPTVPEPAEPVSDDEAIAWAHATNPSQRHSLSDLAPSPQQAEPAGDAPIAAPAFLRSDKVDEEDDVRLYGPRRRYRAIIGTLVGLALLGGIGFGAWYFLTQRDDASDIADTPSVDASETAPDDDPEGETGLLEQTTETPTAEPTAEATAAPEPTVVVPSYWADIAPILNSGSAAVSASTYAVSPANRAVLTGHTAAITGITVSDDGRVLTSGADRRLVDWGADVTLASPDVKNVQAPLTVLTRTADEKVIAGDSIGQITILDLADTAEPVVLPVHRVAISAIAELADGRLAVASVDGDVHIFALDTPREFVVLTHDGEVTALVGLPDGQLASAAVDGLVRIWPTDGTTEPGEISTLTSPVTAMTLTSDGQLAAASVDGAIHIVPAVAESDTSLEIAGHVGAVRALHEMQLPDGTTVLASGGDDTSVRLWDLATGLELRVLEGHGDIISGIATLPDGRIVSISGDGTGRVWDLNVPAGTPVIPTHDWNVSALKPWDNDQFVTGGIDGKVLLASTSDTTEPLLISEHDAPIVGLSVLPTGDIVSLDASSVLRVNQATGATSGLVEFSIAPGATAMAVRESLGVVTGHADGSVRFHDFEVEGGVFSVHGSGVNDLAVLSTGQVLSAGQDQTVRIMDFENPNAVPIFDLHTAAVDVVVELSDGRVASAGTDGIYIWTVEGLAEDHVRLNGNRARTLSLVSVDDTHLLSASEDGRVRLWDLDDPSAEPTTVIDIPGIVNPYLIQADNGLFASGAARGYVVFSLN